MQHLCIKTLSPSRGLTLGTGHAARHPAQPRRRQWALVLALFAALPGCSEELQPVTRESNETFGSMFFQVFCQRVAYLESEAIYAKALSSNQATGAAATEMPRVDVAGDISRAACRGGSQYLPYSAELRYPRLTALVKGRSAVIAAMDQIFPESKLGDVQDYLTAVLPLTDDGSLPTLVDKVADLVKNRLESDTELHAALALLLDRDGYLPRSTARGLLAEVAGYPGLSGLLDPLLAFAAKGGAGHTALLDLLDALGFELRAALRSDDAAQSDPQQPSDKERPMRLLLDFLLKENVVSPEATTPILVTRRDPRGAALVRAQASGTLPAPFVDKDQDGLADLDATGRFVTSDGKAAPMPFLADVKAADTAAGRDSYGRALDSQGALVYQTVDLDTTILGGLGRDALSLFELPKDIGFKLLTGASTVLGPTSQLTKTKGKESLTYQGYDPKQSALLDLAWGGLQALRAPSLDSTLELADTLLAKHEGKVTRLLAALLAAIDIAGRYDKAKLDPKSNLYDELVVVIQKILRKQKSSLSQGLLEDLLHALTDPRTHELGAMFAPYMDYADVHVFDSTGKVVDKGGGAAGFSVPVNRSLPDSGTNRSIFQRLIHLLNNTSGMALGNKAGAQVQIAGTKVGDPFTKNQLFYVKDAAVFFVQSIAYARDSQGKLTTTPKAYLQMNLTASMKAALTKLNQSEDELLATIAEIDGLTTHPTPEALAQMMFSDKLSDDLLKVMDPPADVFGHPMASYHRGTLVSWLLPFKDLACRTDKGKPCTIIDAIRPLAQAFADHDAEDLFVELMKVLHRHYPSKSSADHQFTSPKADAYATGAGGVTWEPVFAEILGRSDLLPALSALAPVIDTLTLTGSKPAAGELRTLLSFLVDPASSKTLTYRDGTAVAKTTDGLTALTCTDANGMALSSCVTPFYLVADAVAGLRKARDAARTAGDSALVDDFDDAVSDIADTFLAVEGTGESSRLKRAHFIPIARQGLKLLRDRLTAHAAKGDTATWLSKTLPDDIEDIFSSPVVPRAVAFLKLARKDSPMRLALFGLLAHLLDADGTPQPYRAALSAIGDVAQLLLDDARLVPLMHTLGKALERQGGIVEAALAFLKPSMAKDSQKVLPDLLKNAFAEQTPGKSALGILVDLALQVNRQKPGVSTPRAAADLGLFLTETRRFLSDAESGLTKFFELIKKRCQHKPCSSEPARQGPTATS